MFSAQSYSSWSTFWILIFNFNSYKEDNRVILSTLPFLIIICASMRETPRIVNPPIFNAFFWLFSANEREQQPNALIEQPRTSTCTRAINRSWNLKYRTSTNKTIATNQSHIRFTRIKIQTYRYKRYPLSSPHIVNPSTPTKVYEKWQQLYQQHHPYWSEESQRPSKAIQTQNQNIRNKNRIPKLQAQAFPTTASTVFHQFQGD